jgi:hypothetical protein
MVTPAAKLAYAPGYPIADGADFNESPCPTTYTFSIKGAVAGDLARLDFIIESATVTVPMIAGTNTGDWTQVGTYVANGQTLVSYVAHIHTAAVSETAMLDWGMDGAPPAVDCNIFPMVQMAGLGEKVQWAVIDVVEVSTPASTSVALPSITKHVAIPLGGACTYNAIGVAELTVESITSAGVQAVTSVGHSGNVQVTALNMETGETIAPKGTSSEGWFSALAYVLQATPSTIYLPQIVVGAAPVLPLAIGAISAQTATVGVPFTLDITELGVTGTAALTETGLPAWAKLVGTVISGTPTAEDIGTSAVTLTLTESA